MTPHSDIHNVHVDVSIINPRYVTEYQDSLVIINLACNKYQQQQYFKKLYCTCRA